LIRLPVDRVNVRPSHLQRSGQSNFAGGALTRPLTKGVFNTFGNPETFAKHPRSPFIKFVKFLVYPESGKQNESLLT
jgi:hypothetical protein